MVLVNQHRAALGLPALATSPTLTAAATWKARHLANLGYFAHDDPAPPVARTAAERIAACGYPSAFVGENIALGQPSPAAVMAAWLASPGHRANLERPEFRAIGVGVAALEWVQDFGDVADAGSLAGSSAAPPPAPAPPPPTGAAASRPAARATAVRLRFGCRVAGPRTVRCRVRVSRSVRVRAALRRHGRTYAVARARRVRPTRAATLRLRARRPLGDGRYVVVVKAGGRAQRRVVRVR